MANLWNLSLIPALNSSGEPYSGRKAYFFDEGTTTPRTTYTDKTEAIPHDHPVVADSAGAFPAVFLQSGTYRLRITDADDVVLYDVDGISPPITTEPDDEAGDTDAKLLFQTGMYVFMHKTGAQDGFVRANGRTIGNAASGATERANADTEDLFTLLWGQDATLTVSGGRGASAAGDFVAGKTIATPDIRGRVLAALQAMGNSSAGLIDDDQIDASETADTLGATGGAGKHSLTEAENGPHAHGGATGAGGAHSHTYTRTALTTTANSPGGNNFIRADPESVPTSTEPDHTHTITSSGSGTGHNNVQPTVFVTCYIKL